MIKRTLTTLLLALAGAGALHAGAPVKLAVGKDTHLAIVGNALPDRMQHDGTLEAFIHRAYPQADVAIRNLGFAADEVASNVRTDGVPPMEEWLKRVKADVVLAFWGFNESFKGPEGLGGFKSDLDRYLKELAKKNFNGKGAPRVVLFSPIAQEKPADPNYPEAAANNANLRLYSEAMAAVAKANEVQFVDLFTPSQQLYKSAKQPLTHNGIHLTLAGYQALAPVIYKGLFAAEPPPADAALAKIREAVQVKNTMWHSYYRTVDQYNIYGGRSTIGYQSGDRKVDNRAVLWPELAVRNVMTENREKRVWALAKGGDLAIDDANLPVIPKIKSNKPGPKPDGSHNYLSGQDAIRLMSVPNGVKVELVASEAEFPELVSPVQMAWDTKGRLWVSSWKNYPERTPLSKEGDKLLVFDLGADGKATKCTTYMDGLNCPTGFQFYKDGVVVMESPELWYLRDTNGDGKGELVERVLNSLDAADSHHETNSMAYEPGGAIYLSDGVFHRTQVETAWGPVRNVDGAIYRWEPRTGRFERYIAYGFANPHGKVFDYWGTDIVTDGTDNQNFFAPALSTHLDFPLSQGWGTYKQFWKRPARPSAGTAILSSRAWPEPYQGSFLCCNVIGMQGIFRAKISDDGAGLKADTVENLISSRDPNFRPVAVSVAPDGSIYFLDWHKPLIGHLQHHLRDPNREQAHGRIYRLTFPQMPLLKPARIAGEPLAKVLDVLKEPENGTRERAKIELGMRDTAQVMAAVDQWVAGLDKGDKAFEHHVLEALWVKQWHNVVDETLLRRVLQSPEPRARAQAVRVLCYQRDRVPEVLPLLKKAANDEHLRVRLEAVRAASFFRGKDVADAFEVAHATLKRQSDYYIEYAYKQTLRQLGTLVQEVPQPKDPEVLAVMVERMTLAQVLAAPPNETLARSLVERQETSLEQRNKAITDLAKFRQTDRVTELLAALQRVDTQGGRTADELAKLLAAADAKALAPARAGLVTLTEKATQDGVRRAAWSALLAADANPPASWAAAKTDAARAALLGALINLPDPALRAKFQPILTATLGDAKTAAAVRAAALLALPLTGGENARTNFATLAAHIQRGLERAAATRAITLLPRTAWDKAQAAPLTAAILAWAKTVPPEKRTAPEFIETLQVGNELAALLPEADAKLARKELRGLGVSVFLLKTVREEMRYDITQLVVEAGKRFEISLENMDGMAHNLVVVKPGQRQRVAESVQTNQPTKLDKKGRAFVPDNDPAVLAATRLVEAGQKESLSMTAPAEPGAYEYVCTFPGHWQIMWGRLIVVTDLDAPVPAAPVPAGAAVDHSAHQHSTGK